jgi:DNA polymerase IV
MMRKASLAPPGMFFICSSVRRPSSPERLYLDFDSFFASAEQAVRPDLRGRPVGVIPTDSPNTCLIAISREAKARGLRGIVSVREARLRVPDIALVVQRPDLYVRLHHRILVEVDRIVPVLAARSIDELVADISGWAPEEALERARAIKRRLAATISPFVTCSIGLGANELLAKIAAEYRKPDGLVVFFPAQMPTPLLALTLSDLPGIARGMEARLRAAGVHDIQGLLTLAPKQARAIWGSVEGERFWAQLHGYAIEKPATRKSMFGHSRVLPPDWRTSDRARACARLLTVKAARRMRREGYAARRFSLSIRGKHGEGGWAREIATPPAIDDHAFLKCLDRAWPAQWPRGAAIVAITLHGLDTEETATDDLFMEPADRQRSIRWLKIAKTMDRINKRYGRDVVSLGERVEPPGGYAGAKIAFGRIPDLADF